MPEESKGVQIRGSSGAAVRLPENLDYFIEWRPWLWRRPVARALEFMGDLRGKRLLEVGGGRGRMSCLFALQGAKVTFLERRGLADAEAEVAKWGVAGSVRLIQTKGGCEPIAGELFDVIFTKSVLWAVKDLDPLLAQFNTLLAPGGKVAFLENYRGGRVSFWVRRNIIHRGRFLWEKDYFGITPSQIALFRNRFNDVRVRRRLGLVYEIFGYKK